MSNVIDFSYALRRAAQRVPGPVAERSLAQARPLRLMADYHDLPLPELMVRAGPIRLGASETWCARCGNDGFLPESDASNRSAQKTRATCIRCGSTRLVRATAVLRTDEYYVAQ
jgi:hypothetical protein